MNAYKSATNRINQLLDFIENHYFASESDLQTVANYRQMLLTENANISEKQYQTVEDHLLQIQDSLIQKEVSPEQHRNEIVQYGISLANLEQEILDSIKFEQNKEHQIFNYLLVGLLVSVLFVDFVIVKLLFQDEPGFTEVVSQAFALTAAIFLTYLIIRLVQNAREAAERMDEKAIAIKFIRYGLKAVMTNAENKTLLEAGVEMFLAHHTVSSVPISDIEFKDFRSVATDLFTKKS